MNLIAMPHFHWVYYLVLLMTKLTLHCPEGDVRCLRCGGSICLSCLKGYANNLGECIVPLVPIDNCLTYQSAAACSTCQYGFSPTNDGKCDKIAIDSCLVLDGNRRCKICDAGVLAQGGLCDAAKKCATENCVLCSLFDRQEICELCDDGYTVFYNGEGQTSCVVESPLTKNCHTLYYNDLTRCLTCDV